MPKKRKSKEFIRKSEFIGGRDELAAFIDKHLRYPQKARFNETQGTVFVAYSINEKGRVVQARVLRGIGDGCDEEALRLVRMMRFTQVKNRGRKVITNRSIGIRFAIHKQAAPAQMQYRYVADAAEAPKAADNDVQASADIPDNPQNQDTAPEKPTAVRYGYTLSLPIPAPDSE